MAKENPRNYSRVTRTTTYDGDILAKYQNTIQDLESEIKVLKKSEKDLNKTISELEKTIKIRTYFTLGVLAFSGMVLILLVINTVLHG